MACRMNVSAGAVAARDLAVFAACREKQVPVCMLLSGGYAAKSAEAVTASLSAILKSQQVQNTRNEA